MIRRPLSSTLFPTRRSSDLGDRLCAAVGAPYVRPVLEKPDHGGERPGRVPFPKPPAGVRAHVGVPSTISRRRSSSAAGENRRSEEQRLNSSHVEISYAVFCL